MKFVVESSSLNKALKKISPVIQKTTSLPILEYVKVSVKDNVLAIVGTNLRQTIETQITCKSVDDGEVVLPFRKLLNITSTLSCPLDVSCDKKGNIIKYGRGKYDLDATADVKDFPQNRPVKEDFVFEADSLFLEKLHLSKSFVSTVETETFFRDVFISVKDQTVNLFASDRLQIFHYKQPAATKEEKSFLFCVEFINAISGLQAGTIIADKRQIKFISEDKTFTAISLLNESEYPDILSLTDRLSTTPKNVSFDAVLMASALNQITVFDAPYYVANFILSKKDEIQIKWHQEETNDKVEVFVDSENETECQSIGLNVKQLKSCLSALLGSEKISFAVADATKPMCIYGDSDSTVVIITPVVIQ